MANVKHYVLVSITLGAIAAASALLIGATNMLTKENIARNEQNKVSSGIAGIFGESAKISSESSIEKDDYKYVNYVYEISSSDKEIGYAFKTTGSNMYGKVSLIIGFDIDSKFVSLSVVTNEQTYASTLVDNYIIPVNEGTRDIYDVNCGATYGAKLVRDMIDEAQQASLDKPWKE